MANLTLRSVKGSPLTNAELDGNFEYFTGSHAITGSLIVTGGITGSLQGVISASYAATSSHALMAQTSSYALTASYVQNAQTASYVLNAQTASYVLNAVSASSATTSSYALVAQTLLGSIQSASYAATASLAYTASYVAGGNVDGTVALASNAISSNEVYTAKTNVNSDYKILFTDNLTLDDSSNIYKDTDTTLLYNPGLNKLTLGTVSASAGFTGSLLGTASNATSASHTNLADVATQISTNTIGGGGTLYPMLGLGSTGNINLCTTPSYYSYDLASNQLFVSSITGSLTGSLLGTASNASQALTSSHAIDALNATFAQTASYVENAQTASYVENAQTASYVENAQTASYVANAVSASYVANAVSASYAATASYVSQPYEIYKAILSYNGGVFTTSIIENTIGNIVWSDPSIGVFRATLTGAFVSSNVGVTTPILNTISGLYFVIGAKFNNNIVNFQIYDLTGSPLGTSPNFNNFLVEIVVN